jgi:hypothetical protein
VRMMNLEKDRALIHLILRWPMPCAMWPGASTAPLAWPRFFPTGGLLGTGNFTKPNIKSTNSGTVKKKTTPHPEGVKNGSGPRSRGMIFIVWLFCLSI